MRVNDEYSDATGDAPATAALTAQRLRDFDHPVNDALMHELASRA
jgi:hypothetical protein